MHKGARVLWAWNSAYLHCKYLERNENFVRSAVRYFLELFSRPLATTLKYEKTYSDLFSLCLAAVAFDLKRDQQLLE